MNECMCVSLKKKNIPSCDERVIYGIDVSNLNLADGAICCIRNVEKT